MSTPVFYAALYAFDLRLIPWQARPEHLAFDLGLQLVLGFTLLAFSRQVAPFLVLQLLLMSFVYIGNALKLSFFGSPLSFHDMHAAVDLIRILPWHYAALLLVCSVATLALAVVNLGVRRPDSVIAGVVLILAAGLIVLAPGRLVRWFDAGFKVSTWDRASNLRVLGSTGFTVRELALYLSAKPRVPTLDEVRTAWARRGLAPPPEATAGRRRDVYVILAESFWDPKALGDRIPVDPVAPELRRAWARAGNPQALSPVTGGLTAEAELELLCGVPALGRGVKFETTLRNDLPCVPRLLAGQDYYTVAAHPNVPAFWNRLNAYARLGFQRFLSKSDFDLDDMNGNCLSDASLLRQVQADVARARRGRPVFAYILTYTGHWPYALAPSRPHVVKVSSAVPQLEAYVNSVWYSSREIMQFVDELVVSDPDALVLLVGDHPPFLGGGFAAYVEAGLVPKGLASFDGASFRAVSATPLLLLDHGRPVATGDRAMFELASLLVAGAGVRVPGWMRAFEPPAGTLIRPLDGGEKLLEVRSGGRPELCEPGATSPACQPATDWTSRSTTLTLDLLAGRQHLLSLAPGSRFEAGDRSLVVTPKNASARSRGLGGPSSGGSDATGRVSPVSLPGDQPLAGDWDGDGVDSTGIFRAGTFYLLTSNGSGTSVITAALGGAGDRPIAGDWDGNGNDTIGVFRSGTFLLRNTNASGVAEVTLAFGLAGDQPIAGDWDGDGTDEVGVYRGCKFFLHTRQGPPVTFALGNPGDIAVVGDWTGKGFDSCGVYRPSTGAVYLKDSNVPGFADRVSTFGLPGDKPVAGCWGGGRKASIGVFRDGRFFLKRSRDEGFADLVFDVRLP